MLSLRASCRFQVLAVLVLSLPSTRRVGSGKLHGMHAVQVSVSLWVSEHTVRGKSGTKGAHHYFGVGYRFRARW